MTGELDAAAFAAAGRQARRIGELVEAMAESTVDELGVIALANVKRARGRRRKSGRGERMITLRSSGSGAAETARVHAGGRVAPILAGGSRAHVIRPHAARALTVPGAARGFAAAVRHPGTRPFPFVAIGLEDTRGDLARITDDAGDELAADIAHRIGRR
jgi:hypothetical protein